MNKIIYFFKAFRFSLIFRVILLYYRELPLRYKLFKKRILGFVLVMIAFALLYYHMEYVFKVFAFSAEAGKYSIYGEVFQSDAKWYKNSVARGLLTMRGLITFYVVYFVLSSIFISVYAHIGKWKEQGATLFWITFLVSNNWFSYAYSFYVCQANVIVLACFLYNFFYWIFILILWDEEMETYYENQVDLASEGRGDFKHTGSQTTISEILEDGDRRAEERKNEDLDALRNLPSEGIGGPAFNKWLLTSSSKYINLQTLQLHGEFAESNVVEDIVDLEIRYKQHLRTFYLDEVEAQERKDNDDLKDVSETPLIDELTEFGMVNYFLVYQIRYWEDYRAWRNLRYYDKIRIKMLSIRHFFRHRQFFAPKVVGVYSLYSPSFKPIAKDQKEWYQFKFLVVIKWVFTWIWNFFSLLQRYQNWRWFLFMARFGGQRKELIKKRKTKNYRFFHKISKDIK